MKTDNIEKDLLQTSRGDVTNRKDFRFPKVWLSKSKSSNLMRTKSDLSLVSQRSNSNWSSNTNSSSVSRTSEISYGCDRQIEINRNALHSRARNTYIDSNFVEFSVTKSQRQYRRSCGNLISKLVNRGTQTDCTRWYLLLKAPFLIIILFLFTIIPGLAYFIFSSDGVNLQSFPMWSKTETEKSYFDENCPLFHEKQHVIDAGTDLYVYENARNGDDLANLYKNMNDVLEQIQSKLSAVEKEVALFQQNDVSQKQMDALVYGHLYGPDADYALETTGGSIIDTPDTTTYSSSAVSVTLFGLPVWNHIASHPRLIIKGTMQPGQCWAFHGSEGRVIIQLAHPIKISSVGLEHFPAHLLPATNDILSTPRHFSVTGLSDCIDCSGDEKYINLGLFEYKSTGPSRQVFHVQHELFMKMRPVQKIEFHFKTNHGNEDFTCVYRVRVYGKTVISNL